MRRFSLIFAVTAMVVACAKPVAQEFHVIPMPATVNLASGTFCVKGAAVNFDEKMDQASVNAARRFVASLETATGKECKLASSSYQISTSESGPCRRAVRD